MIDTSDKPILVLDFDGVLHSYTSGWKGADVISDPPVPGSQNFCSYALKEFNVVIISSRCNYPSGARAIENWLVANDFPDEIIVSHTGIKPPAFVTLDDRAIQFKGKWPTITSLLNFKPWNKKNV